MLAQENPAKTQMPKANHNNLEHECIALSGATLLDGGHQGRTTVGTCRADENVLHGAPQIVAATSPFFVELHELLPGK